MARRPERCSASADMRWRMPSNSRRTPNSAPTAAAAAHDRRIRNTSAPRPPCSLWSSIFGIRARSWPSCGSARATVPARSRNAPTFASRSSPTAVAAPAAAAGLAVAASWAGAALILSATDLLIASTSASHCSRVMPAGTPAGAAACCAQAVPAQATSMQAINNRRIQAIGPLAVHDTVSRMLKAKSRARQMDRRAEGWQKKPRRSGGKELKQSPLIVTAKDYRPDRMRQHTVW